MISQRNASQKGFGLFIPTACTFNDFLTLFRNNSVTDSSANEFFKETIQFFEFLSIQSDMFMMLLKIFDYFHNSCCRRHIYTPSLTNYVSNSFHKLNEVPRCQDRASPSNNPAKSAFSCYW